MDVHQIVDRLEWFDGTFPRQALRAAIAQKDEVTPYLLEIIDEAENDALELLEQDDYMGHIYAMYLLAQFREKKAYPLIFSFFSLPGELASELTGDLVTESLHRILASVSCGDLGLIQSLAENEQADEFVRYAALESLLCLVAAGEISREEVMGYYKSLFNSSRTREPFHYWNGLVSCSTDLYPEEVLPEIKQAFAEGLVDEMFIDLGFVDRRLALGKEQVLAELGDGKFKLIEDTVAEMEWWACFHETQQQVATKRKVGRNEPCPCGSGRKYKKCCGAVSNA
jgi:hypothetical protein